LVRAHPW